MESKASNTIVKVSIVIAVLVSIVVLTSTWLRPFIIESLGGFTEKQIETRIDTVKITIDTIYPEKKEHVVDVKNIPKPNVQYTSSSTTKGNLKEQDVKTDSTYVYKTSISDTLIDGNIESIISPSDCKLLSQRLVYTPKFPIFIEKTITVEKTNTETLVNKPRAKIGVGISGASNVSGGGMLVYQTPKGLQLQGGYMFTKENLDESFKNRQGYITFSIIKLF